MKSCHVHRKMTPNVLSAKTCLAKLCWKTQDLEVQVCSFPLCFGPVVALDRRAHAENVLVVLATSTSCGRALLSRMSNALSAGM
jgi:hypothetical protein